MTGVDKKIVDYYQSRTLPADRLELILETSRSARRWRFAPAYAVAAMLLLTVVVLMHQRSLVTQRTTLALREAAMNHITKLQLDVEARGLDALQAGLAELPFDIELPDNPVFGKLALLGGRYCTISGNLAAHLKFNDPESQQQYSLFVTPYAGNLEAMESDAVEMSGIEVNLWRENDKVFAMAKALQQ
jgi:hypothetical protein